jgi:periplasmic divalent cation tolerance protein
MDESDGAVVVFVTGPDENTLTSIAERVVGERLAACVNVIPGVRSVYRWDDDVQTSQEALGIMKTTRSAVGELQRRVLELHPYEVPEFIVIPVESGSPSYLDWVMDSIVAGGES